MNRHHHLIDQSARFIDNLAEMLDLRRKFRWLFFAAKNFVGDDDGIAARKTDESDGAFTGGRGDGRDRVAGDRLSIFDARRSYERTSFSAAMHFLFCSIVPTEMRTHSGKL